MPRFCTTVLGFVKDKHIPMGPFRCLTVNWPEGAPDVELVLEPMSFPQTLRKSVVCRWHPGRSFPQRRYSG
jgi:hypothetical protein